MAAMVSARTEAGSGGPRTTGEDSPVSYREYAEKGIRGLQDHKTIKFYAEAWEAKFDKPGPSVGWSGAVVSIRYDCAKFAERFPTEAELDHAVIQFGSWYGGGVVSARPSVAPVFFRQRARLAA